MTDQYVTDNSSAERRHRAENYNAENIYPLFDGDHRTRYCESDSTDHLKYKKYYLLNRHMLNLGY